MVAGWAKGDGRVAGVEDGGRNVLDALDGHRTAVHEDHRRRYACGAGRLEHGQRELLLQLGRRDVRAVVLLALVPARIVCATRSQRSALQPASKLLDARTPGTLR